MTSAGWREEQLSLVSELAAVWRGVQGKQTATMVERIAGLDEARFRIIARGGWTAGPSTVLDIVGLVRAEVVNCRVLAWLLDPLGRHGIGARLLESLADRYDLPVRNFASCRTSVEIVRGDTRADIVIDGLEGGRCVVIEAKIDAPEGLRQAARIEHHWPEASHLLYLTVAGRPTRTAADLLRWQTITWAWFAERVLELLDSVPTGSDSRRLDARRAAEDWAAGVLRHLN